MLFAIRRHFRSALEPFSRLRIREAVKWVAMTAGAHEHRHTHTLAASDDTGHWLDGQTLAAAFMRKCHSHSSKTILIWNREQGVICEPGRWRGDG